MFEAPLQSQVVVQDGRDRALTTHVDGIDTTLADAGVADIGELVGEVHANRIELPLRDDVPREPARP